MLFKNLTDENKKRIIDSYNNRAISGLTVEQLAIKLSLIFNVSERTIRNWFSEKLNSILLTILNLASFRFTPLVTLLNFWNDLI